MPIYRKKPVLVKAFQLQDHTYENSEHWPQWLKEAKNKNPMEEGAVYYENEQLMINTLEGIHKARKDDFIIKGVHGELYPCKPDIFEKTYEYLMSD